MGAVAGTGRAYSGGRAGTGRCTSRCCARWCLARRAQPRNRADRNRAPCATQRVACPTRSRSIWESASEWVSHCLPAVLSLLFCHPSTQWAGRPNPVNATVQRATVQHATRNRATRNRATRNHATRNRATCNRATRNHTTVQRATTRRRSRECSEPPARIRAPHARTRTRTHARGACRSGSAPRTRLRGRSRPSRACGRSRCSSLSAPVRARPLYAALGSRRLRWPRVARAPARCAAWAGGGLILGVRDDRHLSEHTALLRGVRRSAYCCGSAAQRVSTRRTAACEILAADAARGTGSARFRVPPPSACRRLQAQRRAAARDTRGA